MHRFYLPPGQCAGDALRLTDREAHHALHVLRLHPAELVMVLDGAGREFLCEVTECRRDSAHTFGHSEKNNSGPALPNHAAQAMPKGKIIEDIIEKAVELGVARIVPLLSERVTARLDDGRRRAQGRKMAHVAIEAIKQCGSAWLPQVEHAADTSTIPRAQGTIRTGLGGFAASRPPPSPRSLARISNQALEDCRARVCVWIGPEGDFTPEELNAIQRAGAQPISLGRLVLRVETAAIYCLSILNYELLAQ